MNERPILFSAPMVRAILADRKTVTRRVAKPVKHPDLGNIYAPGALVLEHEPQHVIDRACPYGQPGDRLWVRETHAQVFEVDIPEGRPVGPVGTAGSPGRPDWKCRYVYRADGEMPNVQWHHVGDSQPVRWTPSIHMPRAASRIPLEITAVRVERLQDISPAQVTAEGVSTRGEEMWGRAWWIDAPDQAIEDARKDFADLWNSTGGTWQANPWVWVVEFKRLEARA